MDKPANQIKLLGNLTDEKGFKLINLNVSSLFRKIDQCRIMFSSSEIDVVTLSETWLKNSVPTVAVDIDNYCCIRHDRDVANTTKKAGGGLATYIHNRHRDNIQNLEDLNRVKIMKRNG